MLAALHLLTLNGLSVLCLPVRFNREHSKFVGRIWLRRTEVLPPFVKVG
jgi:hypothetical protein